jgi:hypothetical protein
MPARTCHDMPVYAPCLHVRYDASRVVDMKARAQAIQLINS